MIGGILAGARLNPVLSSRIRGTRLGTGSYLHSQTYLQRGPPRLRFTTYLFLLDVQLSERLLVPSEGHLVWWHLVRLFPAHGWALGDEIRKLRTGTGGRGGRATRRW